MSRALLLVGSPKAATSASRSFGEAVTSRLEALGWETSSMRVSPAFRSTERMDALLEAIAAADLVVLSFPLYVDTLPAPVTRLLETWAERGPTGPGKRLAVLAQCGFPEAHHCDTAVEVCRRFAAEAGIGWAGHLAFGMGGGIEGRKAEQSPLAGRVPQFDAAAEALARGGAIPVTATEAFARPLVPPRLYPLFGQLMWRREAKQRGCVTPLGFRRYAQ